MTKTFRENGKYKRASQKKKRTTKKRRMFDKQRGERYFF